MGSVAGSTHRPPHATWPAGQLVAHTPLTQTSPLAQATPGLAVQSPPAPQCTGSLPGSTQRPPHTTCPVGQLVAQPPETQISPDVQTSPADAPVQSSLAPQ